MEYKRHMGRLVRLQFHNLPTYLGSLTGGHLSSQLLIILAQLGVKSALWPTCVI